MPVNHVAILYTLFAVAIAVGVVAMVQYYVSSQRDPLGNLQIVNSKLTDRTPMTRLTLNKFKRVLIIGNSCEAKSIEPLKISPDVLVIGVNRAYQLFWPHILMFHDAEILAEMMSNNVLVPSSTRLVTTTYIYHKLSMMRNSDAVNATAINKFMADHNTLVLPYNKDGHCFTMLQAILATPKLTGLPEDRIDVFLGGITLDNTMNSYFFSDERKAQGMDSQFMRLTRLLNSNQDIGKHIYTVHSNTAKLQSLMPYVPLETLYELPLNIVHVKYSRLAWAPDAIVSVQRRVLGDAAVHLVFEADESDDVKTNAAILKVLSTRKINLIHYHNRTSFAPLVVNGDVQIHTFIQYHSEPERVQLDAKVNERMVISQYHALLPEYKNMHVVRNVIDYSDPMVRELVYTTLDTPITIGFSPSVTKRVNDHYDKGYEETVAILEAVKAATNVEVDVITGVPLEECMARKARCDILIDECKTGSFHRCTLEAMALGKIAVVHINPPLVKFIGDTYGWAGGLPVVNADLATLQATLIELVGAGKAKLQDRGRANREWMEKCWGERDLYEEFMRVYRRAI